MKYCLFCGAEFTGSHHKQVYCSADCRKEVQRTRAASAWHEQYGAEATNPVVTKTCAQCKQPFSGNRYMSRRMYCSERCSLKAQRPRRRYIDRCREYGVTPLYIDHVTVQALLKRDKARCHICKKRVDATLSVPHPLAPTIDHLIPVSQGGSNAFSNCKLAHLGCNCRRRSTA